MKTKLLYFFLLIGLSINAQKKVQLDLKYENTASLIAFLDENKVDYNVKDLAVLDHLNDWITLNNNDMLSVPEVFFFNSEGNRIVEEFNASSCGQTLKDIEKIRKGKSDPNDTLNQWLATIDFPFTKEEILTESYDLYVVIFYAKFIRPQSVNLTAFNWYTSLKELNSIKAKPILVSLDIMDNWKITKEQKKALKLE